MKTPATMTLLLFAATLGLQAQTTASPSSQQTEEQRRRDQQANSATSPASSSASAQGQNSSQNASTQGQLSSQNANENKDQQNPNRYSQSPSSATSTSQSQTGDSRYSSNQPAEVQRRDQNASTSTTQGSQTTTAQTGVQSNTSSTAQTNVAVNTQAEAEVRTVVQQIDAQGPVVVERISTRFADVTCTEENARALVEALHSGTSVTLRGDDGQTATFTPTAHLGYGEAYIAMSLAVEALKQAGITGCASPAQWQAVLMGGELSGGTVRTTSVTTERFPGILVLHEQGGWAKVAQTTNIQLSQVVSQANTNLQLNNSSSTASTTSTSGQDNLSPTGFERGHDPRATDKSGQKDDDKSKDKKDHEDHGVKKGQDKNAPDKNAPDMETPPKSETPPKY